MTGAQRDRFARDALSPNEPANQLDCRVMLGATTKKGSENGTCEKHLNLLGMKVEDKVTGFKGVVASISFDLYGCVQAIVNPGADKDGKLMEQCWFDVSRLALGARQRRAGNGAPRLRVRPAGRGETRRGGKAEVREGITQS